MARARALVHGKKVESSDVTTARRVYRGYVGQEQSGRIGRVQGTRREIRNDRLTSRRGWMRGRPDYRWRLEGEGRKIDRPFGRRCDDSRRRPSSVPVVSACHQSWPETARDQRNGEDLANMKIAAASGFVQVEGTCYRNATSPFVYRVR